MLTTNIRGGKVFAAEQKICELKKRIFKTKKRLKKIINSKEIIRKATNNTNNAKSEKYGLEPEIIEKSV